MKFLIHTISTLSIRQYGEIDRLNDIGLLRRWFNPFPVSWFDTESFFNEFKGLFGGKNSDVKNEVYRILAYNKIVVLDQILKTMSAIMRNQNDRSMFALLFKRPAKEYIGNMPYYTEKVKQITGIEVKDGNDLTRLQKEIQRLLDKFKERFPDKKQPEPKAEFMELVLGVFSIMEMAYVPEMKLYEFGQLKDLADKKIAALEKLKPKK